MQVEQSSPTMSHSVAPLPDAVVATPNLQVHILSEGEGIGVGGVIMAGFGAGVVGDGRADMLETLNKTPARSNAAFICNRP